MGENSNSLIKFKKGIINKNYIPFETKKVKLIKIVGENENERLTSKQREDIRKGNDYLFRGKYSSAFTYFDSCLDENSQSLEAVIGRFEALYNVNTIQDVIRKGELTKVCEQVVPLLLHSEKNLAESVISALAYELMRNVDDDQYLDAAEIYSSISSFDYFEKEKVDTKIIELIIRLIASNEIAVSSSLFCDLIKTTEDYVERIFILEKITCALFAAGKSNYAEKYNNEILKINSGSFYANQRLLMMSVGVNSANNFLLKTYSFKNYELFDQILMASDNEAGNCFVQLLFDMLKILFNKSTIDESRPGNTIAATVILRKIIKYDTPIRAKAINYVVEKICLNESGDKGNLNSLFDECVSNYLSDDDKNEALLRYADSCLRKGYYERAGEKYNQSLAINKSEKNTLGKLLSVLRSDSIENIKGNLLTIDYFDNFNELINISDENKKEYYTNIILDAIKNSLTSIRLTNENADEIMRKIKEVENIAIPLDKYIKNIKEAYSIYSEQCQKASLFSKAKKGYEKLLDFDTKNEFAIWGMLCCRLKCVDDDALVNKDEVISETTEYKNIFLSKKLNHDLSRFSEVAQRQQTRFDNIEKARLLAIKKKKIIKIVSIVAACAVFAAIMVVSSIAFVNAQSKLLYKKSGDGYYVKAGIFYDEKDVEISDTYNGKYVIGIKKGAFKNKKNLENIDFPSTISVVEDEAFKDCHKLSVVYFDGQVYYADDYINDNQIALTEIGSQAFYNCTSLQNFAFPSTLKSIGEEAFFNSGLTEATVFHDIGEIGDRAFAECQKLTTIFCVGMVNSKWGEDWKGVTDIGKASKVSLDYNGGTKKEETKIFLYGKDFSMPTSTRDGYQFVGWYSTINTTGQRLTDKYGDSVNKWQWADIDILHAVWKANTNTLRLVGGQGVSGAMKEILIDTDQSVKLPYCSFTKEGYTFMGWSTSSNNGTVNYSNLDIYKMGAAPTNYLFAVFTANVNSIIFYPLGASGTMKDIEIRTDETITLPKVAYTYPYHDFLGWSTSPNGKIVYKDGEQITMDSKKVWSLYAVWKEYDKFILSGSKLLGLTEYGKTLQSISIPSNITTITREAFSGANKLNNVYITNGATTIESYAFKNCENLISVFISKDVTSVDSYAFYNCNSSIIIYCEAESVPSGWSHYWNYSGYGYISVMWKQTMPLV